MFSSCWSNSPSKLLPERLSIHRRWRVSSARLILSVTRSNSQNIRQRTLIISTIKFSLLILLYFIILIILKTWCASILLQSLNGLILHFLIVIVSLTRFYFQALVSLVYQAPVWSCKILRSVRILQVFVTMSGLIHWICPEILTGSVTVIIFWRHLLMKLLRQVIRLIPFNHWRGTFVTTSWHFNLSLQNSFLWDQLLCFTDFWALNDVAHGVVIHNHIALIP